MIEQWTPRVGRSRACQAMGVAPRTWRHRRQQAHWLYLSSFVVLLGAEINAELEHQTRVDTTVGTPEPRGSRGAVVADATPDEDGGQRR